MGSMIRWDSCRGRSALCGGLHSMKIHTRAHARTHASLAITVCRWKVFAQSHWVAEVLLSDEETDTVHMWFSQYGSYTHTHTYIPEYGLHVHYKRYFSLIEVLTFPSGADFLIFRLDEYLTLPSISPTSQLIRRLHCVWTPPAAPASLWTRRLDQCPDVWGRQSQSRPRGPQSPCCTLSIPLISLRWLTLTSLSAEEISGFFYPLEIKIT